MTKCEIYCIIKQKAVLLLITGHFMDAIRKILTSEKENGRVYTPEFVVQNILDLSGYFGAEILKKHIIDNSCGDGAFLCEVVKRYCNEMAKKGASADEIRSDLEAFVHGIDIDSSERSKCMTNLDRAVKDFGVENVAWDILCADALCVHKYDGKMDFVLGNPPYVRVHNLGDSFSEVKNLRFAQHGMTDLYIAFYEIGIKMLSEKGVLGYITPSSFFNSLAGGYMRKTLVRENLLDKVVDFGHFQAFRATTYNAIVILKRERNGNSVDYYRFDEKNRIPYYVDSLLPSDYFVSDNFYFSEKKALDSLSDILCNAGKCDISVKNGYATLCDNVFVHDFDFDSKFVIPVVKASRGIKKKIFFPYDRSGHLYSEAELRTDEKMYTYLCENKQRLVKRSNENDREKFWFAFGRSQAINDTYKDKLSVNALVRTETDFKFVDAPSGTGVYGGLYILCDKISPKEVKKALASKEFISYVSLLGKYKSGGYYTFSSKDVKTFLDYIFAYDGGLFSCLQTNSF